MKFLQFFSLVLFSFLFIINNSEAHKKKLGYEQVFLDKGEKILSSVPELSGWFDSDNYLITIKNDDKNQILKVNAATGDSTILVDLEKISGNLPGEVKLSRNYKFSKDYSAMVISSDNDIYYYSIKDDVYEKLAGDEAEENNPRFSPDGKFIAYTKNRDLYFYDLKQKKEYRLTEGASDVIYNGYSSWVYYEEILERSSRYAAFWWSPDSKKIAFLHFDDSPVPNFPIYHSEGQHGSLEWERYPEAGDPLPKVKLGIISVKTQKISWVNIEESNNHMLAWPFWSADSKQLLFQWMNREQNNLKIYSADPESGEIKEIYDEKQNSWVEFFEDIYCFKNGSGFILRSDESGWSSLYYYDYSGNLINRITTGDWTVSGISYVDEENNDIYFTGSKVESTENHLYKSKLNGTGLVQITGTAGTHKPEVSPGGLYYYDKFSSFNTPAVLNLYETNGEFIREIANSKLPAYDDYELGKVEYFRIPAGDGFDLPAYWILPPDFDPSKKYPVLFKEYGGPGSKSVRNSFPGLSNFYYAQRGIIIFSVDHRGSGHFGKNGMALMHRNLGKWEMFDYTTAAKLLRKKPFVDENKIGITGGSYGGYITCLALTKESGYFKFGIANYSVTDWRLYDNGYTERYMDTPGENPEGYKKSSVFEYIDNYKSNLRLTHGTIDDNVHTQNSIQLTNKLINAGKDFELMLYPGQRHGYRGEKRKHAVMETNKFWFENFLNEDLEGNKIKP